MGQVYQIILYDTDMVVWLCVSSSDDDSIEELAVQFADGRTSSTPVKVNTI